MSATGTLLLLGLASARLSFPAVPPKSWEDFDRRHDAAYNLKHVNTPNGGFRERAGTAALSNVELPVDQNGAKLITGEADVLKHGDTYFLYFNNFGDCPGVDCCESSGGCASCCFGAPPTPYLPGCGIGNATPGGSLLTHARNSSDPYGFYHTVQVYSTTDFTRFENLGVALPLTGRRFGVVFRPHVVYNPKLRNFVMWFEDRSTSGKGSGYSVAVSNTPAGPFTVTHDNVTMPGPGEIGDFDIFVGALIRCRSAHCKRS